MKFRDFKKIDSTATHTIFQHPDGHTIQVAHEGLDPSLRKQMREIPIQKKSAMEKLREERQPRKLAEGTDEPITLEDEDNQLAKQARAMQEAKQSLTGPPGLPVSEIPAEITTPTGAKISALSYTPAPTEQAAQPVLENFPIDQGAEQAKQEAPALPPITGEEPELKAISQYEKGGREIAEAQKLKAVQEIESINQANDQKMARMLEIRNQEDRINSEIQTLEKARAEQKIDPNRYMGSRSTVQKVFQTIGLILGGIGSGLTGQPNLAYKVLESNIERDIDQQKSDIETTNNLLGAYYKKLGNLKDAENMVRLDYLSQVDSAAKKAAAQTAGMEAQGRLNQFLATTAERRQLILSQLAESRADAQLATRARMGIEPTLFEMGRLIQRHVPEKLRDEANKEVQRYAKLKSGLSTVSNIMDQVMENVSLSARLGRPIESREVMKTLKARLFKPMKDVIGERFTDSDFKILVEGQLPSILASKQAGQKMKDIILSNFKDEIIPSTTTLQQYIPGFVPMVPPTATPIKTLSKK